MTRETFDETLKRVSREAIKDSLEEIGITMNARFGLAEADVEAMARALVAEYRAIWPGAGWPDLKTAVRLVRAALAAMTDERALIVAWIRSGYPISDKFVAHQVADAIERGDHLKESERG